MIEIGSPMTGTQMRRRRLSLDLDPGDLARLLGVSEDDVLDWEAGAWPQPNALLDAALSGLELARCCALLRLDATRSVADLLREHGAPWVHDLLDRMTPT
jgi:hypothetical protein